MNLNFLTSSTIPSLLGRPIKDLSLEVNDQKVIHWGESFSHEVPLKFNGQEFGVLKSSLSKDSLKELSGYLVTLIYLEKEASLGEYALKLHDWVMGAKNLEPSVTDWIGVYYKGKDFLAKETTDLFLGPYWGEYTDHQVIPLERGLCGLALREERVVNVANVHDDTRHIACSLKTNSELIIPLKDKSGKMVAELDIDCNRLGAFTTEIEKKFRDYCETFSAPEK